MNNNNSLNTIEINADNEVLLNSEYNMYIKKINSQDIILEKINELYDNVIINFRKGNLVVYNPNILNKLSRTQFINWVIEKNPEIYNIFY
ncbi:hypothetical protein QLL95_gp1077 [Cotonvirus japonicus]|uniref:Uncharacterized protein n=1 Tax=Cotonvirus japonicus TaxID=2811091 RepID=A0ABM7NSF9_9VIRU|nr:hypothetical protein QLL95_gp1077 [Cotonvirus japonicus]BCS83046.1 hypothetical protein [Cotonvirus japonicus]